METKETGGNESSQDFNNGKPESVEAPPVGKPEGKFSDWNREKRLIAEALLKPERTWG
jgi:hypothetical protein